MLEGLLRERLRKFMALLLKVLAEDSDEAVHDLRVWSRRLQQVLTTLSPSPLPPHARTIVRALRRGRRSVGAWRDCDVLIDLLERKARRIRNPEEKEIWEKIRALALNGRERAIRRARRRLASRKLFTLAHRTQRFLDELAHGERQNATGVLAKSISEGYAQWRQALSLACDGLDPPNIHAFRIRAKQLRYRIELARDLGERNAQTALAFLKSLQDELGCWHDRTELFRLTAEALADPDLLLKHPRMVATLLHKADREQAVQRERIQWLLTSTYASVEDSALDTWVARYCREIPPRRSAASQLSPASQLRSNALESTGGDCAGELAEVHAQEVQDPQTLPAEPVEDFIKVMGELPS